MKTALVSLLLLLPGSLLLAAGPAAPAVDTKAKAPSKEIVITAAFAGAEFNRLHETVPDFKKAATVDAALDSLVATSEPVHKALDKDTLAKNKKEVIALLVMQDGRLTGAPLLNETVASAKASTVGAKARRNAQNIVSVFAAASAAGSTELEGVKNLEQAVAFVRTGVKGGGQFAGSMFKADVDDASLKAALTFISFDEARGSLIYNPDAVLENEEALVPAPAAPDAVAMVGRQLKMQAEMEAKQKAR